MYNWVILAQFTNSFLFGQGLIESQGILLVFSGHFPLFKFSIVCKIFSSSGQFCIIEFWNNFLTSSNFFLNCSLDISGFAETSIITCILYEGG